MKKLVVMIGVLCLITFGAGSGYALDMVGKLGVGVDGGIALPSGGDVTSDSSFSDYFNLGPSFGLHVDYCVIPELSLRTGFRYTTMKMDDDANEDISVEPYFSTPSVYLNGVFNLGSFFKNPDNAFNPYVTAGVGMYFWKVTDDGMNGDAIVLENNEELSKTSFGLNGGVGFEYFATDALSIFAEGTYDYIFTEDEDTFGKNFSNLGSIGIRAGLTYHFSLGSE